MSSSVSLAGDESPKLVGRYSSEATGSTVDESPESRWLGYSSAATRGFTGSTLSVVRGNTTVHFCMTAGTRGTVYSGGCVVKKGS